MKNLIRLEELAMFGIAFIMFIYSGTAWWWFAALLLLPDISMLAYLGGPATGAVVYNLVHHKAVAIIFTAAGFFMETEYLYLAGLIMFAHSSMDRLFGYGLKLKEGFQYTHLGRIGN